MYAEPNQQILLYR